MELHLPVRRKDYAARRFAHQLVAKLREMSSVLEIAFNFYCDHD